MLLEGHTLSQDDMDATACGDACRPPREASVGSEGHPHTCARPCKFAGRPQGCSNGANCSRCHLCEWHGRGLDPYPKKKDGTPWVYQPPPEKKPAKVRQPIGLEEASAAAERLGGQVCRVGIPVRRANYVELCGVVTSTAVEENILRKFAPGYDLSQSSEAMLELQTHLASMGFTAAPNSIELVDLVSHIPEPDIDGLRRTYTLPPGVPTARLVKACVAQLERVAPPGALVMGVYKSRARIRDVDNASSLHKDDVLLTEDEVTKALFPSRAPADDGGGAFDRYESFCAAARQAHPTLGLPPSPGAWSADLSAFTRELVGSVRRYNETLPDAEDELILDNVNVWIPRDSKRIAVLPLSDSSQLQYPLEPGRDVDKLKSGLAEKFQALPQGAALIFYGQSVLHQALLGDDFDCGSGSLEGRYLMLTPRKYAHRGSLRDHPDLLGSS